MSTIEDRIQELARQQLNIDRDLDFDAELGAADISSMDAVLLVKKVGQAFNVTIPPEEVAKFATMRDLASYLDSQAE